LLVVDVTGSDWAVLVTLALHADEAGACSPSVSRLAEVSRLSTATVRRALRRLEAAELVATVRSTGRHPSLYFVDPNHLSDRVQPNHLGDGVTQSNTKLNPITGGHQPNHVDSVTSDNASRRVEGVEIEGEPSPPSPAQSAAPTAPTEPPVVRSAEYDNAARDHIAEIRQLHLGNAKRRPR
jgi:predicted transcriptional regulator